MMPKKIVMFSIRKNSATANINFIGIFNLPSSPYSSSNNNCFRYRFLHFRSGVLSDAAAHFLRRPPHSESIRDVDDASRRGAPASQTRPMAKSLS